MPNLSHIDRRSAPPNKLSIVLGTVPIRVVMAVRGSGEAATRLVAAARSDDVLGHTTAWGVIHVLKPEELPPETVRPWGWRMKAVHPPLAVFLLEQGQDVARHRWNPGDLLDVSLPLDDEALRRMLRGQFDAAQTAWKDARKARLAAEGVI